MSEKVGAEKIRELEGSQEYGICEALRKLIFKLDRNQCVQCGQELRPLKVHHLRYRVPCRVKDFVTLCDRCHQSLHRDFSSLTSAPKFTEALRKRKEVFEI